MTRKAHHHNAVARIVAEKLLASGHLALFPPAADRAERTRTRERQGATHACLRRLRKRRLHRRSALHHSLRI